jgi:hypothetical protein
MLWRVAGALVSLFGGAIASSTFDDPAQLGCVDAQVLAACEQLLYLPR